MSYPNDCRFSKDHEWIRVVGERGTVGITDFAQKALGDVVFVDLPVVGRVLAAGEVFGTVESVKAVSELYSSGEVVEVNASLADVPETVNADPHDAAWMIVVRLTNAADLDSLLDATAYEALVASQSK